MSAFLELDCLKITLLLLLLVAIASDAVEYRRALTYIYYLPDTLAHICAVTSTNKNLPKGTYNLEDKSQNFSISWDFPDGNVFKVLKLLNIVVRKDLIIIQREICNGCGKGLYVRKLTKEHILLYGGFICKFHVYSISWIINEIQIKHDFDGRNCLLCFCLRFFTLYNPLGMEFLI